MALPVNGSTHLIPAYYSFYRPRKDERLSWPSWLTCSGWLTLGRIIVKYWVGGVVVCLEQGADNSIIYINKLYALHAIFCFR